jgi:hypothetical protein
MTSVNAGNVPNTTCFSGRRPETTARPFRLGIRAVLVLRYADHLAVVRSYGRSPWPQCEISPCAKAPTSSADRGRDPEKQGTAG